MTHAGFLRWLYSVVGFSIAYLGLIVFFSFSLNLSLALICCSVLKPLNEVSVFKTACLIGLLALARYGLTRFNIKCDLGLRQILLKHVLRLFDGVQCDPSRKKIWKRFVTLDIITLSERLPALAQGVFYILCGICLISYLLFFGSEVFWILVLIIPYVCISKYISKKTTNLIKIIYKISQKRIHRMSLWLSARKYFVNWGKDFGLLKNIDNLLQKEVDFRNKDSFLKCLDFYIIIFSRSLNVIFFMIWDIFSEKTHLNYLAVYWFSIPMISLIMEAGRFTSDYTLAKQAAANIASAFSKRITEIQESPIIVLDKSWDIWEGTLRDNILFFDELNPYLKLLRLDLEFQLSEGKDIFLTRHGTEISSGQKDRILLLRSISIALQTNACLRIEIDFHSVDSKICASILKAISLLEERISIEVAPHILKHFEYMCFREKFTFSENNSIFSQREVSALPPSKKAVLIFETNLQLFRSFFSLNKKHALLFLVPALCLSLIAYFCSEDLPKFFQIPTIFLLSVMSILCASKLGAFIEDAIRNLGKKWSLEILTKASLSYKDDILQRIGKDLTVVFERLSWYVHDLSWYASTLSVGIISICLFSPFQGTIISTFFIGGCMLVWFYFIPRIKIAQENSALGVNQFLSSVLNYNAIGSGCTNRFLRKNCLTFLTDGFSYFEKTNACLVSLKANFSNTIHIFSGLLIAMTLILSSRQQHSHLVEVMLTALLMVDHTISKFLQAASGFHINHISYRRLTNYPLTTSYNSIFLIEHEKTLSVPVFINSQTKFYYRENKLEKNKLYSLTGPSGQGKSVYLKYISGLMDDPIWEKKTSVSHNTPLYFDHKGTEILKQMGVNFYNRSFYQCFKEMRSTNLLIMDEVFQGIKNNNMKKWYEELEAVVREQSIVGIIIDHRFRYGIILNMEDLQIEDLPIE